MSDILKKRVFVSDIHMSAGRSLLSGYQGSVYDWLNKAEADSFASFLCYLKERDDLEEVVLLGDLLDDWVHPIDQKPPTFMEVINAPQNQGIVNELKALCANPSINVLYIPGNHHMFVKESFICKCFPGIVFGGQANNNAIFTTGRIHAEHGSSFAMFNAPDPTNDPRRRIPLGYYISRVVATKATRTGVQKRSYATYIDDFFETIGPERLAESVWEAVLEEANIRPTEDIIMQDSYGNDYTVTQNEIRTRYANLYDQWKERVGTGMAIKAIMAEIGYLGDLEDNLYKKGNARIVVFVHSHDYELDIDKWFVDDRIYANCGTWTGDGKPSTWVETKHDKFNKIYTVCVKKWEDNRPIVIGKAKIIKL